MDNINTRSLPPPQGKDGWGGSAVFALLKLLVLSSPLLARWELHILQSLAVALPACLEQVCVDAAPLPMGSMSYTRQALVLSIIFGQGLQIFPVVKSNLGGGADTTQGTRIGTPAPGSTSQKL